jgi:hypothetical protein
MYSLYVRRKKITDRVKRIHDARVRLWKLQGAIGLKPKLYRTVEDVFSHGLDHPSFVALMQDATIASPKSTR